MKRWRGCSARIWRAKASNVFPRTTAKNKPVGGSRNASFDGLLYDEIPSTGNRALGGESWGMMRQVVAPLRRQVLRGAALAALLPALLGCADADLPGMGPSPAPYPVSPNAEAPSSARNRLTDAGPNETLFQRVREKRGAEECAAIYREIRFRFRSAAERAYEDETDGNIIQLKKRELEEAAKADIAAKYSMTRAELDALYYHFLKAEFK
jgi:hypothetical protein